MKHRIVAIAMGTVLSFSAAGQTHAAPWAGFHHPTATDKVSHGKMISFSLRNGSKEPLVLQADGQQITIEPGKTAALKMAEGAEVVTVSATPQTPAGSVLTKVTKVLQGNTLAVR